MRPDYVRRSNFRSIFHIYQRKNFKSLFMCKSGKSRGFHEMKEKIRGSRIYLEANHASRLSMN